MAKLKSRHARESLRHGFQRSRDEKGHVGHTKNADQQPYNCGGGVKMEIMKQKKPIRRGGGMRNITRMYLAEAVITITLIRDIGLSYHSNAQLSVCPLRRDFKNQEITT